MSILSRLAALLREESTYWRDPDRAEKSRQADEFRNMTEDEYDTYLDTQYRVEWEQHSQRVRERAGRVDAYLDDRAAAYETKHTDNSIGNTSDVRT